MEAVHLPEIGRLSTFRGAKATAPTLLIEAPHGATTLDDYRALAARLRSKLPEDLHTFFTMNTDVGSGELAQALAEAWITRDPAAWVLVLRCAIPRTFIDVNRLLQTEASGDLARGGMTAAVPPFVDHPADLALLAERYQAYDALARQAYAATCGRGGRALIVHTYGPRTVGVARVDETIVQELRRVHAPELAETWPLRAEIDLITRTPEGALLAPADWVERARAAWRAAGFQVEENLTYNLHPATTGAHHAARFPGQVLCFEVRRDLLVEAWRWDQEMAAVPARVRAVADPLVRALTTD